MQLKLDEDRFDELQAIFIGEVIDKVRIKLAEAGLKGLELEEITASIAFSIASTIDDTSQIEANGVEVHPYITFRDEDDNLIHSGENSCTYDFVRGALQERFDV
ncbi:MAG: hypothetical protein U5S82_08710 [Gammaproteobacteria bacterium]|nr:hypothetical protein [Gammaproteobacteria bacterium]